MEFGQPLVDIIRVGHNFPLLQANLPTPVTNRVNSSSITSHALLETRGHLVSYKNGGHLVLKMRGHLVLIQKWEHLVFETSIWFSYKNEGIWFWK